MQNYLERLVDRWRNEVTGKEIVVLITDDEFVRAALIPPTKAGFAHVVWYIQVVKPMGAFGAFKQGSHPCSTAGCIRRKVEYDRKAVSQEINQMRRDCAS
jgi:hypothetical protein